MNFKLLNIEIWPYAWYDLSIVCLETMDWNRSLFGLFYSPDSEDLQLDLFFIHLIKR